MVKEKRWKDAKEFYTQGLGALTQRADAAKESAGDMPASEEKEKERTEEKKIEEALYVNRALCNLELRTFSPSCSLLHDALPSLNLNQ